MTPSQLDELERLEREATPGEWRAGAVEKDAIFIRHDEGLAGPGGERVLLRANKHYPHAIDVEFIAAARNALPALLAAARELEAAKAQWIALKTTNDGLMTRARVDVNIEADLRNILAAVTADRDRLAAELAATQISPLSGDITAQDLWAAYRQTQGAFADAATIAGPDHPREVALCVAELAAQRDEARARLAALEHAPAAPATVEDMRDIANGRDEDPAPSPLAAQLAEAVELLHVLTAACKTTSLRLGVTLADVEAAAAFLARVDKGGQ